MAVKKHFVVGAALALVGSFGLVACGGGGSGEPADSNNAFASAVGNYQVACTVKREWYGASPTWKSSDGSVTIGTLHGTDRAEVSVHMREYSSSDCADSAKTADFTLTGEARDLAQTKDYVLNGAPVTAKVVEVTYEGLKLSLGRFSGQLPAFGTTSKRAVLLVGDHLYLSQGNRGADGLSGSLSEAYGVKQ